MKNTEFYTTPSGDVMIESEDEPAKLLKEEDDVIRYAKINFRGQRKKSMLHSVNTGMVTAQNVSTV